MPEKILVIQTAFIGDAILTLPMIEKLAQKYPSAVIDVIAIPSTGEIFRNSPFVNEVLIFEKRGKHKSLRGIFRFASELKKRNYSRLFSPHRSFRTSLLVLLSGIGDTSGFNTSSMSFVYKNRIQYRTDFHEVRRLLEIAGFETDADNWKMLPEIKESRETMEKIDSLFTGLGNNIIAMAPGSVWETKKYPAESYIELAKMFIEKGYRVLLLGSSQDEELCCRIAAQCQGGALCLAGKYSLTESVYILKKCRLLISNDSAPTHMSLMARIPVVTLFCSTLPSFGFYPYHSGSIYLSYELLSCKPCGIHGLKKCPLGTFECAFKLAPAFVFEQAKQLLS